MGILLKVKNKINTLLPWSFKILGTPYFDAAWYRKKYNVSGSRMQVAKHYLETGWKWLYDPSEKFSTTAYMMDYHDVLDGWVNPLWHYLAYGADEGRKARSGEDIEKDVKLIAGSEYFDAEWYRRENHLDQETDAARHYLLFQYKKVSNPSPEFSAIDYLIDNQKYMGGLMNPLLHYEKTGKGKADIIIRKVGETESSLKEDLNRESFYVDKDKLSELSIPKMNTEPTHTATVDIIICVYNALEDVRKCIASVVENTSEPYRIIIVNDNSNQETREYLIGVSEQYTNIKLIHNESDKHGYTYAANIGLRNSDAQFSVLLNSDTIVTDGWIDRMIQCAESDSEVGIVGPLSNTASWQSIPQLIDDDGDWCHNVIPQGFDVKNVGDMIAKDSVQIYPKVPLLNGFCLMIKREVIDKIGYFDEENFGRGFAEEDDYNTRAVKAGFKLAVADDTYIFHAQSKSYSDEKRKQLSKLSGENLRAKHGTEYIESACDFLHYNFLLESFRCRTKMLFERESLLKEGKDRFAGLKIAILLPTSNASGGGNVVIQEARSMIKMGASVTIINLERNREAFEIAYPNLEIPVIWLGNYKDIDYDSVKNYDAVICTEYSTVECCAFLEKYKTPRLLYYIQDYEPYFFQEGENEDNAENYEKAVQSYTLVPNCINFTKTEWNRNEVKSNTGAECVVVGPSVNLDLFRVRKANCMSRQIVVTAMIRPETKRRGPEMTMNVLRKLKEKYGNRISIRIFGSDPKRKMADLLFFKACGMDFEYINYGLLNPKQTSMLLAQTDVFLDLSTFQAMGLTAMEAMCCGCATVVPVHGGTSSFAVNNENALVIDTLQEDVCLEAAEKLIDDIQLRTELSRNAFMSMCNFYPEKVAYNILSLIRE